MTITDWSAAPADQVVALYRTEAERWYTAFDWDTSAQWREVEQARTRFNLPGLIARDDSGRPSGWLFYLPTPQGVQLGGVSAGDPATARALVQEFAARVSGEPVTGFMPALTPELDSSLADAGFSVTAHSYLVAPLDHPELGQGTDDDPSRPVAGGRRAFRALPARLRTTPGSWFFESRSKRTSAHPRPAGPGGVRPAEGGPSGMGVMSESRGLSDVENGAAAHSPDVRLWRVGDEERAAEVLREAYEPAEAALFAPDGSPEAWTLYVRNLVEQIGCGRFMPEASLVSETAGVATGVAIVTRLSDQMAHLAQIGVRRRRQGSGEGARLLHAAMTAAHTAGATSTSLLVSGLNEGAVRFYARHGFAVRGRFLEVAASVQPDAGRRAS